MSSSSQDLQFLDFSGVSDDERESILALFSSANPAVLVPVPDSVIAPVVDQPLAPVALATPVPETLTTPTHGTPPADISATPAPDIPTTTVPATHFTRDHHHKDVTEDKEVDPCTEEHGDILQQGVVGEESSKTSEVDTTQVAAPAATTAATPSSGGAVEAGLARTFMLPPPNVGGQAGQQVYPPYPAPSPSNPPLYNPHMPPPSHPPPPSSSVYTQLPPHPPPVLPHGATVYVANCHVNLSPYGGGQPQVPSNPGPSQSPPAPPMLPPMLTEPPPPHMAAAKASHEGKGDYEGRRFDPSRPSHHRGGRGRARGRGKRPVLDRSSSGGGEHPGYGGDGLPGYGATPGPYIYPNVQYPVRGGGGPGYPPYPGVPAPQTVQGVPLMYSQPQYVPYPGHLVPYQHQGPNTPQHPPPGPLHHLHPSLPPPYHHQPEPSPGPPHHPQAHHYPTPSHHQHQVTFPDGVDPNTSAAATFPPSAAEPSFTHHFTPSQPRPASDSGPPTSVEMIPAQEPCTAKVQEDPSVSEQQQQQQQQDEAQEPSSVEAVGPPPPQVDAASHVPTVPSTHQTQAQVEANLVNEQQAATPVLPQPSQAACVASAPSHNPPQPQPSQSPGLAPMTASLQHPLHSQSHPIQTQSHPAPPQSEPEQPKLYPAVVQGSPHGTPSQDQPHTIQAQPQPLPQPQPQPQPIPGEVQHLAQSAPPQQPPQTRPSPGPAQSEVMTVTGGVSQISVEESTHAGGSVVKKQDMCERIGQAGRRSGPQFDLVHQPQQRGRNDKPAVTLVVDQTHLPGISFMSDEIQPNVEPDVGLEFVMGESILLAQPGQETSPGITFMGPPVSSEITSVADTTAVPATQQVGGEESVVSQEPSEPERVEPIAVAEPTLPPAPAPAPAPPVEVQAASTPPGGAWAQKKSWSQLFKPCEGAAKQVAYVAPFNQPNEKPREETPSPLEQTHTIPEPPVLSEADIEKAKIGGMLKNYVQDHRQVALQPRGLTNKGYWCYVNAPLQALLSCPPFYNLMHSIPNIPGLKKGKSSTPVIDSIVEYIHEFSELGPALKPSRKERNSGATAGSRKEQDIVPGPAFEPSYIYKMLASMNGEMFKDGRQQDAEEMLSFVLNGLHDEMVEALKLAGEGGVASPRDTPINGATNGDTNMSDLDDPSDSEEWQVMGPRKRCCVTRTASFTPSPISAIFWGQLRSVLHQAGLTTANLQPFTTLPLDIQSSKVESVKDALEQLVSREEIPDYTDAKTNQDVTVYKQVVLEHLPSILILQLKRFIYDKDGGLQKVIKRVNFPIDLEITKELMSSHSRNKFSALQRKYKLLAVVYHDGKEATKGHYVADIYHSGYNCWLRCDDSYIKEVPETNVVRHVPPRVPYLLFYRRADTMVGPSSKTKS